MARMPFARYMARIVGETPAPYVVEAMEWLWGEEAIRRVVRERKAHRVRNYYCFIRRQFRRCDEVIGQELLIDEGQMSVCAAHGRGHVYQAGIVKSADVVIVESRTGRCSLAFEVILTCGVQKRNGRYARRRRKMFVVQTLPRGDRGTRKEREGGTSNSRRSGGDRDAWDAESRRLADSLLRSSTGDGRKAGT